MTVDLDHAIKTAVADIIAAAPPIPPFDDVDTTTGSVRMQLTPVAVRHPRTSRAVLAAAAAVVALGIAAVALVGSRADDAEPADQPRPHEPIAALPLPADAPAPGTVVPALIDPPDEIGEALIGRRDSGSRTGYWTAMSIGQVSGSEIRHPITIMIFDGTWKSLDGAATVTLDGRDYLRAAIGDVEILARQPEGAGSTIAVSGEADLALLQDVIDSVVTDTDGRPFAATVALPTGYTLVAPLRELADDPTPRRTLVAMDGTLVINEVSDWVDPLTYATSTGADLQQRAVGESTAWSGTVASPSYEDLTFLVWAPNPYVVFEIVAADPATSSEFLAAIADAVVADSE